MASGISASKPDEDLLAMRMTDVDVVDQAFAAVAGAIFVDRAISKVSVRELAVSGAVEKRQDEDIRCTVVRIILG